MTPQEKKQQAVELVAAGKMTSEQIAEQIGVCRRTITTWKADKHFLADVAKIRNAWREKARTEGAADRDHRLRVMDDLLKRLRGVVIKRSKDKELLKGAGGDTGLLTVTYKMQSMGEGQGSEAKPEYRVDTGLVESILAVMEQAAIEKGHRKEKIEVSGAIDINQLMDRINAGRKRVAEQKALREAREKEKALPSA